MSRKLALAGTLVVLALALIWFLQPEIKEQAIVAGDDAPASAEQIKAGEYLARAGNCVACHSKPGQPPYSGARRIPTPFGDLFSSNLTPDNETGLGQWSSAEFYRALRYGKSRDGRRLYPAFPYTNYTRITREDSDALFAFLQSLPPVRQAQPAATLRFPYNTQLAAMAWRALYFNPEIETSPRARSASERRGEYLVEGLGHCSACHTPRNALGGERSNAAFAGGAIPMMHWDAPALAFDPPLSDAAAEHLRQVLKNGTAEHSVATGPMAEVVFHSLQYLSDADIAAMVDYLRILPARASAPARQRVSERQFDAMMTVGRQVYQDHCADCHGEQGQGEPYRYPALAGNALVTAASATNAIQTVLYGGFAPSTHAYPQPYGMPPFAHQLSKNQIAAVLTYIRSSWGNDAGAVGRAQIEKN
ncbi:cytochrome c [Sinimarinibacterium sp. NLF-5-8]|uniref:c-type cytochrome n=1 Tax=Sinimarinibacterium sp. NLF-5-8 TaxID=2698684 RepID=UPI00137C39A0|nr:cytochrome c [Sinimarinibacterium sp. NLF-5-8]QHS11359.1 c-type cytochrome [Sinimarinibacterium sp. NLF-5-8]